MHCLFSLRDGKWRAVREAWHSGPLSCDGGRDEQVGNVDGPASCGCYNCSPVGQQASGERTCGAGE